MAVYSHNIKTVNANTSTAILALSANPNRVTLIVSSTQSPADRIGIQVVANVGSQWYTLVTPTAATFTYKDYGPLIQQPVYIFAFDANATVVVTEVYKVE